MAETRLHGTPVRTCGEMPAIGAAAPGFALTDTELAERTLAEFKGTMLVLNIFPSLDTPVCALSVRHFNGAAVKRPGVRVLCISQDLPFAHKRFCATEGLENVTGLSSFRSPEFGRAYGLTILDGPLAGLLARAVIVVGVDGRVVYRELVPEIAQEPDYTAALAALD